MAASAFLLIASFLLVLLLLARPLGGFLARLIEGEPLPALRRLEAGIWRCCGTTPAEMNWWQIFKRKTLLDIVRLRQITCRKML